MKAKAGLIPGTFDPVLTVARLVVGGAFLLMVTLRPTIATPQEENAQDQGPAAAPDVFKPPKNLFQLRYEYMTAPGGGGAARDVVGIRRGAISGDMKVSFQAARSIG
jgi:hypothetical protein